jgi:hypothetical protein
LSAVDWHWGAGQNRAFNVDDTRSHAIDLRDITVFG